MVLMELTKVEILAKELMQKYGLDDYRFLFDTAVDRFGFCNNTDKIISLSGKLTELNEWPQIQDTILHEIAHALTPHCSHNEVWQRVAKAIGANGKRCYDDAEVETPMAKWTAKCPECGFTLQRHMRNKRLFCSSCHKKHGRFAKSFQFKWILNK